MVYNIFLTIGILANLFLIYISKVELINLRNELLKTLVNWAIKATWAIANMCLIGILWY